MIVRIYYHFQDFVLHQKVASIFFKNLQMLIVLWTWDYGGELRHVPSITYAISSVRHQEIFLPQVKQLHQKNIIFDLMRFVRAAFLWLVLPTMIGNWGASSLVKIWVRSPYEFTVDVRACRRYKFDLSCKHGNRGNITPRRRTGLLRC